MIGVLVATFGRILSKVPSPPGLADDFENLLRPFSGQYESLTEVGEALNSAVSEGAYRLGFRSVGNVGDYFET